MWRRGERIGEERVLAESRVFRQDAVLYRARRSKAHKPPSPQVVFRDEKVYIYIYIENNYNTRSWVFSVLSTSFWIMFDHPHAT